MKERLSEGGGIPLLLYEKVLPALNIRLKIADNTNNEIKSIMVRDKNEMMVNLQ